VNTHFDAVVSACSDRAAGEYEWITGDIRDTYNELHRLGWAHSVEAWSVDTGELVGGLYGVAIGGFFSGESMFNRQADASKAALVALAGMLRDDGHDGTGRIIDVQWLTPHLASLGAVAIPRAEYLGRLARAVELPLVAALAA
jgi:leucyl/phenylalanyl-tRNA--protein transferase